MTRLAYDANIAQDDNSRHPVISSSGHLSSTGCQWRFRDADMRAVAAMQQHHNLPEIVARVLVARGISPEEADDFLNPSLRAALPDPSHLLDMDIAANRIAQAIIAGEKIAIFGDYDVDGATSSALLTRYFRALGNNPIIYIPDRMKEGYGPNAPAMLSLAEKGANIIITVDCGTLSFGPLEAAANAGLDVIVIDHHQGAAERPKALAIVNPNRLDENSPHGQLAAVGVAFLFIVAINRALRERGYFTSPNRGEAGMGAGYAHNYPLNTALHNARELRKNMTDAEELVWQLLRSEQLGFKFRKQHPVGHYIADFACLEKKLIIELDGGQHNETTAIKKDEKRTAFLEQQGFTVLRFWNHDVLQKTEAVMESIYQSLHANTNRPHPSPPPTGEGITEPDIRQFLDIVALGTVCDVVPLVGVNRALVAQGLKVMTSRHNLGISTVLDMAGVDEKPGVYACGFIIGPRINAGGRVGKSDLGVRLLTTDDETEAKSLAAELETHNAERKAIEAMVLEQATLQAETMDAPLLVVAGAGWHPGVIGIVAGRLKERFHKPVAIIALDGGIGKASARSVSGVDFGASVIAAKESGLLIAGGGHAMAAGFTVEEEKIPALTQFLTQHMHKQLSQVAGARTYNLDGIISISGATPELLLELDKLGPFGQGNPNLRLCVQRVVNLKPEIVKDQHVKTLFIDPVSNARLSAIAFRCIGTKLGEALLATRGQTIDVAGQLRLNEWNGKQSVSLHVDDISIP